ncbi:MAG: ATP-binding protein [Planctomycetota bacterium]
MWSETTIYVTVACGVIALLMVIAGAAQVRTRRAIDRVGRAAGRLARGDLSQRVPETGPSPVRSLARMLNQMARQLQDRLSTVVRQRNELGAVLSSMVEGVVAIDNDERIISLNAAAATLLRLDPANCIGRSIQEVIRNTALQKLVAETLESNDAVQSELTLRSHRDSDPAGGSETHIQAQSALLRGEAGERLGAVLVLHDVTKVRRLESVRRDFVANVSHEVKTPVAAIKAAIETLIDSPEIDDAPRDRFRSIIARQANRLDSIVEDLLSLARLEQEQGVRSDLEPSPVEPILRSTVESCMARANEKTTSVAVECDPDLRAWTHPMLIEQALVNLVDNAIKYSPAETTVRVVGERVEDEVVIKVIDQGRGIEPEHLPRLFERFYRTDRARSREMGGTGLGLSIVKHVAEAHGGHVGVDSVPGNGSTFRLHLRLATEPDAIQAAADPDPIVTHRELDADRRHKAPPDRPNPAEPDAEPQMSAAGPPNA